MCVCGYMCVVVQWYVCVCVCVWCMCALECAPVHRNRRSWTCTGTVIAIAESVLFPSLPRSLRLRTSGCLRWPHTTTRPRTWKTLREGKCQRRSEQHERTRVCSSDPPTTTQTTSPMHTSITTQTTSPMHTSITTHTIIHLYNDTAIIF